MWGTTINIIKTDLALPPPTSIAGNTFYIGALQIFTTVIMNQWHNNAISLTFQQ